MSTQEASGRPYVIVGAPVHENRWVESSQTIVAGWTVTARWLANGAIVPVFVPESADLAATADALIRHWGEQLDKLGPASL